jgi:uncharacterized damage-inducible protein DinB
MTQSAYDASGKRILHSGGRRSQRTRNGGRSVGRERRSESLPPLSDALRESILGSWSTNNLTTIFLVANLTDVLLAAPIPGSPTRTLRMLAGHIHNARCTWIKTLGRPHGIAVPPPVDRRKVSRGQLARALKVSGRGIAELLELAIARGGQIPPTPAYVWRNLPLDVGHVLTYFAAHEGHHRGQIVMVARQLGHRLPADVTNGLWQWTKRSAEGR